jgi:hypothetical protein
VSGPSPPPGAPEPDPRVLAWQALAEELTPAKSLARMDAATARVLTSVSVVGTVLTGLGLLAAGRPARNAAAEGLALAAVGTAVLAVACALTAQVLTIRRGVNTNNLVAVRAWYRDQFRRRAYPARAASVLLLAALLLAGGAATAALVGPERTGMSLAISQTPSASGAAADAGRVAVTIEVAFRGLAEDTTATVLVTGTRSGATTVLARAALTPGADGTATRTLTVGSVPGDAVVEVTAAGGERRCRAALRVADAGLPVVTCASSGHR